MATRRAIPLSPVAPAVNRARLFVKIVKTCTKKDYDVVFRFGYQRSVLLPLLGGSNFNGGRLVDVRRTDGKRAKRRNHQSVGNETSQRTTT